MKKILFFASIYFLASQAEAQEFNKQMAAAKTAYNSGKLDDSRFAMQQMLQELDFVAGKEILKMLPVKMLDQLQNATNDNVSSTSGFLGTVIHRDFGGEDKKVTVEIISNSPLLTSVNALLSIPLIANNGDNKMIKIAGYKGLVTKLSGDASRPEYELQLPLNSSLITLKAPGYSQDQLIQMANTLPLAQIVKTLQ
jgi:hypothetical protein